ncbi:MAG TPA: glycosyltransferase family 2 protein [Solirubrobacteraceae bacterium]
MAQVTVIGSGRPSAGVAATVRRVRDALAETSRAIAAETTIVVDPAAWYAAQPSRPSNTTLARALAISIAPYGTARMQDDAQVARLFAATAHPDARAADHLARLGCRAHHLPFGVRPARAAHDGALDVTSFGPPTPRRLRALAAGSVELDDLRSAFVFGDEAFAELANGRVVVDVADDDDASPDIAVLLEAVEAGAAVVTERLGRWPGDVAETIVTAPQETLFAHARELARDPQRAEALASAAHAALLRAGSLRAMGDALAALIADVAAEELEPDDHQPDLSPFAAEPAPLTIRERLTHEQGRHDAAVREGVRKTLRAVNELERRVARIESGVPDTTEVLHDARPGADPRVSVLVPAFSATRVLPAALDSAYAAAACEGAPSLGIVVVDDGSPHGDAAVAVEWAQRHPDLPVTVVRHRHNRGLPAARNTALEHTDSELVLPLDADNQLLASGLRRLIDALDDDPGAAFAYGLLREFDESGPLGLRGLYPWEPARLRFGNYIDALALIRREALTAVDGYALDMPEQGYEDWDLWCRFADRGLRGVWIPQVVANYRIRADSMSAALHLSHVGPLGDMLARHPALLG